MRASVGNSATMAVCIRPFVLPLSQAPRAFLMPLWWFDSRHTPAPGKLHLEQQDSHIVIGLNQLSWSLFAFAPVVHHFVGRH